MGLPRGSAVTVVLLSLAGRWTAGEGTPQDAGALGEQVCRWEALFCACLVRATLSQLSPFSPSLTWAVLDQQIPLEGTCSHWAEQEAVGLAGCWHRQLAAAVSAGMGVCSEPLHQGVSSFLGGGRVLPSLPAQRRFPPCVQGQEERIREECSQQHPLPLAHGAAGTD